MGKSEAEVTHDGLRALEGLPNVRVWRNQVGRGRTSSGRWIDFGLCQGSYDYIGIRSVLITSEMVGTRIGQFTAIEFKAESGGRLSQAQRDFGKLIRDFGGKVVETNRGVELLEVIGT